MFELSREQKMIQDSVRQLTVEKIAPQATEIDEKDEFPEDIVRQMAEIDLLTLSLPDQYGGIDADTTTLSLVITEISKALAPMGSLVLSTQSVLKIIKAFGSDELKDRVFSNLSSGDKLLAFCLTEPDAGSDAHSLATTAVRDGDHYILNGTKRFITLAGVSEYYLVVARTAETKHNDLSTILVHKDTPGLVIGKKDEKMGMRGSVTADLHLENARVHVDNRVGEEGQGWHILTNFSNSMRCWGAASIALGIAEGALAHAVQYAKERHQFGRPIASFQAIRFMLADMQMKTEAAKSLIYRTNYLVDKEGEPVSNATMSLVSMAKCYASDVAVQVATDAVQILGGYGVCKEAPPQRMMRDAKCVQIFDGSNQVQRIIISKNLIGKL
ncbi:acyl-CoA dehydrogenase [Desulfosarcina ovata subsp. sediminis]|uniref:Cyclohex-1-ene-1-carbonyl-CoA dehydrogenase n=1 Tax=Desulfosarcina ovata subsp. sediminis TaxID=885957 RepID=A0A5K7ZVJ9_9BACT|nr:acyl-CoA dehydrogenase family protein [Desulfosarcina ovata]BBO84176.1 acyl-CoA dehydrogenase [Desulfosarcina ovata subsp. sediminis]